MNVLSLLTRFYTKLHNYAGIPYWCLTPIRRLSRYIADIILPRYLSKPVKLSSNVATQVIVSFTSFPGRINTVWQVVETIKRQSLRPEKIILWLSKRQFPDESFIPIELRNEEDSMFCIKFIDEDFRSHKKYYYAMLEYPDYTIVTLDDDVYYHPDTIKFLVNSSKKFPGDIIANVTSEIKWDEDGNLLPYSQWGKEHEAFAANNRIQIGVGGVLYPPCCLCDITFQPEVFTKLAPMADDLWLGSMARLSGTYVIQSNFNYHALDVKNNSLSLGSINNGEEHLNDKQLNSIRKYILDLGYPDIFSRDFKIDQQ